MKKVRLFAVAAAMGMFAATVNAAAPKVTKESYIGTWGAMETVVKAEFGGKVILPTANITVTKQTLSTDKKFAPKVTGSYGVGELRSEECYEGFTSKVGKDTNGDGIVDMPLMVWGAENTADGFTSAGYQKVDSNWFYSDVKYFPTAKTSLYYFGMTNNGYGARFLAPNQAARDGVIVVEKLFDEDDNQLNYHGWYENTVEGNQKLIDMYKAAGLLKEIIDPVYGDVIGYRTFDLATDTGAGSKLTDEYATIKLVSSLQNKKYAVEELNAETIRFITGLNNATNTKVEIAGVKATKTLGAVGTPDTAGAAEYYVGSTKLVKGSIYEVKETRDGFEVVNPTTPLTGTIKDANEREITANANGFVFVIDNGSRYGHEVYANVKEATISATTETYKNVWNIENGGFNKVTVVTEAADAPSLAAFAGTKAIEKFGGAYRVDTPENNSDKYVVAYDMGAYSFDLGGLVNSSKGTMTFEYNSDRTTVKEIVTPAVRLGYTWYPAFSSEADLLDFVGKMSGFRKASSTWFEKRGDEISGGKRTWANATADDNYIPQNELDHYKAKQCAYATGAAEAVDASSVTVTSDVSAVDVNKGGVYTATLTAKVGETVVGTKDITVVVAPKYVREYKNGKVTSLKAYHLNGGLYSHTTFDYAKNTSTAVFYAQDGVTAVETVTSSIK